MLSANRDVKAAKAFLPQALRMQGRAAKFVTPDGDAASQWDPADWGEIPHLIRLTSSEQITMLSPLIGLAGRSESELTYAAS